MLKTILKRGIKLKAVGNFYNASSIIIFYLRKHCQLCSKVIYENFWEKQTQK